MVNCNLSQQLFNKSILPLTFPHRPDCHSELGLLCSLQFIYHFSFFLVHVSSRCRRKSIRLSSVRNVGAPYSAG